MQFRALKKVRYNVSENKLAPDNPYMKLLKDTYKQKKGEKIK